MLKVGIVGLPNVGKSTLFKTLTKKQVDCANFPFCTIEPNVGVVEVPDERMALLAERSKARKIIPTAIEFVDIAGLVRGAHKGEGLGNKFLANIREVDMIVHVVRDFIDENVHHTEGAINPARDVETIELELAMSDLSIVDKRLDALKGKMKIGKTKDTELELHSLEAVRDRLNDGKLASSAELNEEETEFIAGLQLLTFKPILYIVNVDETAAADKNWVSPLGEGREAVPVSFKVESDLVDMSKEEQREFLDALGWEESGLDRIIKRSYKLLNLVTFFTSGEQETRAWTVEGGSKAPTAAGKIHSDIERGFIRAEVIFWSDFVELGESGARDAGKLKIEGKDYIIKDGDVCHFRFAV